MKLQAALVLSLLSPWLHSPSMSAALSTTQPRTCLLYHEHFTPRRGRLFAMTSTENEAFSQDGGTDDTTDEQEASSEIHRIPSNLVHALDLVPLMNHLATFACTRRGKEAILDLVTMPTTTSPISSFLQRSNSGRRIAVFGYNQKRERRKDWLDGNRIGRRHSRIPPTPIISLAQSAEDAIFEYQLIDDAMKILKSQQSSNNIIPLPPMFDLYDGVSSANVVDSDDDEWVHLCLGPIPQGVDIYQEIDLQTILQAEQVIKLLLMTYEWATGYDVPIGLVNVVRQMECNDEDEYKERNDIMDVDSSPSNNSYGGNINNLAQLYGTLKGTVEIVRAGPSLSDPNNRFSYQFRLASGTDRFPELDRLRIKERRLMDQKRENSEQLSMVRGEISIVEDLMKRKLISSMRQAAPAVERCMNTLARLDVIFARASFGCDWDGLIPEIGNEGRIHIEKFIHPILAVGKEALRNEHVITPVDLILSEKGGFQALIISGPNGGGKTLALKSFGLAALMAKLALPITASRSGVVESNQPTVHFFEDILVEVGDSQSIRKQESTLMARLNSLSSVIEKMAVAGSAKLVLLDELGGGTDPVAGSALAQSILEKLISMSPECKVVATTHSPQLKALSKTDSRFESASVLMGDDKTPTFQLCYGITGDSFALEAARRARPSFPEDVLLRAAELMNGGGEDAANSLAQYLAELEKEQQYTLELKKESEETWKEVLQYKADMISKLQVSRMQLSRLESRLRSIFDTLKDETTRDTFELVGHSLEELRLLKRRMQTEEDTLSKKGLRRVPDSYSFYEGETVVIIADGEWKGFDAIIKAVDINDDPLTVTPVLDFCSMSCDVEQEYITIRRGDVAIFDNPDWGFSDSAVASARANSERKRSGSNMLNVLSTLTTGKSKSHTTYKAKDERTSFISSRQRKAAASAAAKTMKEKNRIKKK